MTRLAMARGWHHDPLRRLDRLTRLYHMRAHAMIVPSMPAMTALDRNCTAKILHARAHHLGWPRHPHPHCSSSLLVCVSVLTAPFLLLPHTTVTR
jgi:hypothetical protein